MSTKFEVLQNILFFSCIIIGGIFMTLNAHAELKMGLGQASVNPLEENIETQLGGYGEREGKPAVGTHDTIMAKAMLFEFNGAQSAVVALDVCHLPRGLVREALKLAAVPGLDFDHCMMIASHTHAGLEGYSMDARNIAGNPHIGIFKQEILDFVAKRIAAALKEAEGDLEAVTAGAAVTSLPGMNRNRRHDGAATDEDMTVLRFDRADGTKKAVFVNYTAHGTIMTPDIMHVSGGWPGVMQRTVQDLMGGGVVCLYSNGAEGDVAPNGYTGGSRWEMAEQYGRRVGIAAAKLAESIHTRPVETFDAQVYWMENLPERVPAPDFMKIAGEEYQVTEDMLKLFLNVLLEDTAPLYGFRVNDFAMVTFPGEPITAIGMPVKQALREGGIHYPIVAALTNDFIGYILTKEEYALSGYEVTASFYGDGLGAIVLEAGKALAGKLSGGN